MFLDNFDLKKNTSLYIHIPFCISKCYYCAFYSKVSNQKIIDEYVIKLIKEIERVASYFKKPFYTVYIGGGNPGLLTEKQLVQIAKAVCQFGNPVEFTMEINPESLKSDYVELFSYVNRLSVGIQSLNEVRLKKLGRNSSRDETIKGLFVAKKLKAKYHFDLNLDFICCVDNDIEATKKDLEQIFSYVQPEHLSVYELTIEKGTVLYKQNFKGLNEDDTVDELKSIWKFLKFKGFEHYEVSAFAKNNKYCKHNLVYWNMNQYLGLGVSSASTALKIYSRIECPHNINSYLASPILDNYEVTYLNNDERLEEFVIMNLRKKTGINLEILENVFKKKIKDFSYPGYKIEDGKFVISEEKGFLLCDGCALALINGLKNT